MKTIYLIRHSTPNRINVPNKEIPLSGEANKASEKVKDLGNIIILK